MKKVTFVERPPKVERYISDEMYSAILETRNNGKAVVIPIPEGKVKPRAVSAIRQYLFFKGHKPHVRTVNGEVYVWIS